MAKTVKRSVHVSNPETGDEIWLHPGDDVPGWAAKLITNPSVFEDLDDVDLAPTNQGPIDYDKLNITQLDELLTERGLPTTGNKNEKAKALKEHDGAVG